MVVDVVFKTPDAVTDAVYRAVEDEAARREFPDDEAREEWCRTTADDLARLAARFVRWGECVTVRLDTGAGTASVVPVSR